MTFDNKASEKQRQTTGGVEDSLFMRACRREAVARPPVWLMRQAGRYLPEYQAIRNKVTFLELCKNPILSAEVMLATVDRLGVDAAIIFSDLLPILQPMGLDLELLPGKVPSSIIHFVAGQILSGSMNLLMSTHSVLFLKQCELRVLAFKKNCPSLVLQELLSHWLDTLLKVEQVGTGCIQNDLC
jgi:uroporphyrinogen-III decarboxylase